MTPKEEAPVGAPHPLQAISGPGGASSSGMRCAICIMIVSLRSTFLRSPSTWPGALRLAPTSNCLACPTLSAHVLPHV